MKRGSSGIGRSWEERAIARLAIVLAKAPYKVDDDPVEPFLSGGPQRLVRILAWASFTAARRYITLVANRAIDLPRVRVA